MIGKTISHYKILEKLGGGGMGVVYKAEDTKLKRTVALKFLPQDLTEDDELKQRFVREAQAAATLNHPNICTIYEIDECDGQLFIAMEFVKGRELGEIAGLSFVDTQKDRGTRPAHPLYEVLNFAVQIADGLQAAHEQGAVHRDIKPSNIMVTTKGQIKITDFGLAKLAGQTKLTQTGAILGTLIYMSPEQVLGKTVEAAADLWAFGAVLYEIVTGQPPFEEEYQEAMVYSILNEAPRPPTELRDDLPSELERLILKCLCKEPRDRYPSAQVLLQELRKVTESFTPERAQQEMAASERKGPKKRESERRQTTVLCASLSGYSELLESIDPEEAAVVFERCFKELQKVVQRYQGTVDKIVRNSVTVLFGLPQAIEAAPQKAVTSALSIRARVRELSKELQTRVPLDFKIGIDSGTVIASAGDEEKAFSFLGEPVERAAQLAESAPKGCIHVGALAHRFTRRDFEFKNLAPISVKGKKEPVAVFELVSTEQQLASTSLRSERMIHSDMVGRDHELDKLKLHVLKVINGEGSIVSIIGEAGIGKSRLIAELRQIEDIKKVALLEGRALSIGRNLSYHPIIDIIKNWASVTEKDSNSESQAKLEKAIRSVHPEGVDEVFPFLAILMGMKLAGKHAERVKDIEGEAMEKLILKNVREIMMKGAELRPIVYILQDLHWADQTSVELLESLYRLAERHPICFVNVLRPNYPETGERLMLTVKERYPKVHAEIILEPLDASQCDTLIQNLLKTSGIPDELRKTIAQKAEGNPFFIEEVVRSFIDEGALVLENGEFKVAENIESVVVPETIQDVLLTRIDRLDQETKSLLKHASVVGRYFFHKILAEVTKAIDDLDKRLTLLQDVQLILASKRVEEVEYLFKHALAQEVTYESILLKKRKELHLRVAQAVESVFNERLHEFYGMLALHYSKGENLEKAEEYLVKAGKEALKSAASSEALNYYQEALKLYLRKYGDRADPEKIAKLEKNIGLAFYNKGYMAEALKHFEESLVCLGDKTSRNKILEGLKVSTDLLSVVKNLYWPPKKTRKTPSPEDIEFFDLAYRRGEALSQIDVKRMFMIGIGVFRLLNKFDWKKMPGAADFFCGGSFLFGLSGISLTLSQKFLDIAKNSIIETNMKSVLRHKTAEFMYNYLTGNWHKGYSMDEDLIDANLRLGELLWVTSGYLGYSFEIAVGRGDFEYTAKLINKMSDIGETYDYDYARFYSDVCELSRQLYKRDLYSISEVADKSYSFANELGLSLWQFKILGMKARAQASLKDLAGAERSLGEARQILLASGSMAPRYSKEFYLSRFLVNIYLLEETLRADHLEKDRSKIADFKKRAHKSGKDALKLSHKVAEKKPESLRLMGTLYWLKNKQKQALKYWNKSIRASEKLDCRPELARGYLEVGKRLQEPKSKYRELNGTSAESYLDQAQGIFEEMELEWDLEQLGNVRQDAVRTSEVRGT